MPQPRSNSYGCSDKALNSAMVRVVAGAGITDLKPG